MLQALFSFSGRIDRSQFIRWSAFQAVLSFLMLAGIQGFSVETMASLHAGGSLGGQVPNIVVMLAFGILLVAFPSAALVVKRLRDVGLPAWPCFIIVALIDALLIDVVPHTAGYAEGPFAVLAFTMAVTVLLSLAPSETHGLAEAIDATPADWVTRATDAEVKLADEYRRQSIVVDAAGRVGRLPTEPEDHAAPAGRAAGRFGRRHRAS